VWREINAKELAEMDAEGWKREHMQFRPDGKLDVVFSRMARAEKPIDKVDVILNAVSGQIITDTPIVNKPVDDIRKGLMDKRFGDLFDTQRLIEISNRKIADVVINTANDAYAEWSAQQDTRPLGVPVLKVVA